MSTSDFFADLDDREFDAVSTMDASEIRARAHIVNGGDASFPCPSCRGSGKFVSYTGRVVGNCFKCSGKGKVSKGVAAAAKGKVTQETNRAAWAAEHRAEIEYINRRAEKSTFYAGFVDKLASYGTLTEGQLACVRKDIAADEAKRQEWANERSAKSGEVEISAIERLFATATDNDIKRPIFRAEGIEISKAPAHGRNAGALYVKSNDNVYLGKIVNGAFQASREATSETLSQLRAVAVDPTAEAIKYARRTGRCSCCGKGLVDPVSIRAGIGPICADNWGLDYRRELAREELANEK